MLLKRIACKVKAAVSEHIGDNYGAGGDQCYVHHAYSDTTSLTKKIILEILTYDIFNQWIPIMFRHFK